MKFTGIKNTLSRVEWRDLANDHCYKTPMRIYPAVHYTMGGFWVDYNLMSNIQGLHILGEANFPIMERTAWGPALSCKGRRWDKCEMARDAQVLQKALPKIRAMRAEFGKM